MKKLSLMIIFIYIIFPSQVFTNPGKNSLTSVKTMITSIRYKRNEKAIQFIDVEAFSKSLLLEDYDNLSEDQKKQFREAVKGYIISKSFPIALKYFDKIDITYSEPIIKGKEVELPASLLYNGKEKIQFSWILGEKNGSYLVKDFLSEKKLATEVNRKQLQPILKQKGFDELIRQIEKASK